MKWDANIDVLIGFLLELKLKDRYYGSIKVHIEDGTIVHIEQKKSHKKKK
jgi:hypothetical protein